MPKFRVRFSREWTESGEAIVKAKDEDAAEEIAAGMLSSDDPAIEWEGSNMEPGNQDVESVEKV